MCHVLDARHLSNTLEERIRNGIGQTPTVIAAMEAVDDANLRRLRSYRKDRDRPEEQTHPAHLIEYARDMVERIRRTKYREVHELSLSQRD